MRVVAFGRRAFALDDDGVVLCDAASVGRLADDPHSVKPIDSQALTTDADMIRSKIERMGYTDVVDLSRDSMGVWHAKTKRGAETLDVIVDKGGRIKPGL